MNDDLSEQPRNYLLLMTWIIGINTMFGYGTILSDTCVSWSDGTPSMEMLQKTYVIAPNVIGGFSGSVVNGMRLLSDMADCLGDINPNKLWSIEELVQAWQVRGLKLYKTFPDIEKKASSAILLLGIHPTNSINHPNNGTSSPRSYGAILRPPNFTPKYFNDFLDIYSMGSGNNVDGYVKALKFLHKNYEKYVSFDTPSKGQGIYNAIIGQVIHETLKSNPVGHVGSRLYRMTVGPNYLNGEILKAYKTDADGINIELPPPILAQTYRDFKKMCKKIGAKASEAEG